MTGLSLFHAPDGPLRAEGPDEDMPQVGAEP